MITLSCRTCSWGRWLFYIFHIVSSICIINLCTSSEMSNLCFRIRLIRYSINFLFHQAYSILDLLSWSTAVILCFPITLLLEMLILLLCGTSFRGPHSFFLGPFLHFSWTCPLVIFWEMVHKDVKLFRTCLFTNLLFYALTLN